MDIRSSILAGEILLLLENATCSIRIVEFEIILETTRNEAYLAIAKLLSEELIVLIKEEERGAIALNKNAETYTRNYSENNIAEFLASVEQI